MTQVPSPETIPSMRDVLFELTTTAGTFILDISPDGWDESLVNMERSDKLWGVFRSWSVPLKFIRGISPTREYGAKQLRTEFYNYGTKGIGTIKIYKLDRVTMLYDIPYVGKLDYGTFKDSDYTVEVNFLDGGLAKVLKDNGGTEYEAVARIYGGTTNIKAYLGEQQADPYCGVMNITDLVKRLIDLMTKDAVHPTGGFTDGTYGFTSSILTALEAGTDHSANPIVITKGHAFRSLNGAVPGNFKTCFEDLIQSIQWASTDGSGIGVGIETDPATGKESIVIENRSYFFKNSIIVDVGNVKSISVSVNPKLQFNKLKIGFPSFDYENFNKELEPNGEVNWKSPNDTSSAELNMISKYRADSYGIQDAVLLQSDSCDDDVFFMELYYSNNFPRWNHVLPDNAIFTGYPGNVWYVGNGKLTPRRCIISVQKWLESCLFNYSGDTLKYCSGTNNQYAIEIAHWSSLTGLGAYEKESTDITLAAPSLFYPLNIDIEAAFPAGMTTLINDNPTGLIQFTFEDNVYTGYVMSVKTKIYGRTSQKITLLSSATNDLTKLIR